MCREQCRGGAVRHVGVARCAVPGKRGAQCQGGAVRSVVVEARSGIEPLYAALQAAA
jgi:hypothetical protein